jgi:hypothetical protein
MRGATIAFACVLLVGGCSPDDETDTSVINSESPLTGENGISSNGISSNGISSNGLVVDALVNHAISTSSLSNNSTLLSALQATNAAGDLTRRFFRYLVACALPSTASVSYSWRDDAGIRHTEINPGALNLAPGWATGAIDMTGRQWVSACLGARTNALGVNVPISLRAKGNSALQVSSQERTDFAYGEGAFWGDLFADTPFMRSCSRDALRAGAATSQYLSQGRTCATATGCGIIKYVGPCYVKDNATSGQACFTRDPVHNDWIVDCTSSMNATYKANFPVVATWLKP